MSEQELHWLSLRLAGGRLNQARRGESYVTPSAGYVWGGQKFELDPDESVQNAVRLIFERFAIEPSGRAVMRWAHRSKFLMPNREAGTSEVLWRPLNGVRLNNMLHNPVYAGVYVYGRYPTKKQFVGGEIRKVRSRLDEAKDWPVRIDGAHPAYITWERYMSNQEKLRQNKTSWADASRGAPREGRGLLTGVVLCGRCGKRMSTRFESGSSRWHYFCYGESRDGTRPCWRVPGPPLDQAVERLFLQTMVPDEIELSLAVEREVEGQADSLDKAWRTRIEQAHYEARRAERRYKAVDPDNRVMARTLESEWEQRLQSLAAVEQEHAEARKQHRVELSPEDRCRIRELARDLPTVWRASTTSMADRKAMFRLVIEAIALHPIDLPKRVTKVRVQWQSGVVTELEVPRPESGQDHSHRPEVVQRIRDLAAAGIHDEEIGRQLNSEGLHTGTGRLWYLDLVRTMRSRFGIERVARDRQRNPPLPHRHPDGRYSVPGLVARLGVSEAIVHGWIKRGVLPAARADFGTHQNVYWLEIDDATAARLTALLRRRRPQR